MFFYGLVFNRFTKQNTAEADGKVITFAVMYPSFGQIAFLDLVDEKLMDHFNYCNSF